MRGLWRLLMPVAAPTAPRRRTQSELETEIDGLRSELEQMRERLAEVENAQKALSSPARKEIEAPPAQVAVAREVLALPAAAPRLAALPDTQAVAATQSSSQKRKRKRDLEHPAQELSRDPKKRVVEVGFESLDWSTISMPATNLRDGKNFPYADQTKFEGDLPRRVHLRDYLKTGFHDDWRRADWPRITFYTKILTRKYTRQVFYRKFIYEELNKISKLDYANMLQLRPMNEDEQMLYNPILLISRCRAANLANLYALIATLKGVPLSAQQACKECRDRTNDGPFQFCTVLQGHFWKCNNCLYHKTELPFQSDFNCTFMQSVPSNKLLETESPAETQQDADRQTSS